MIPLHLACLCRKPHHVKIAELMLNKGANPRAKTSDGQTPLHIAVQAGNAEMVTLLLGYLKPEDLDMKNKVALGHK